MATDSPKRGRPLKPRPPQQIVTEGERLHHQRALGDRLREQRESRSMSMDDLASKTGMTKAAIYEIEGGKRSPLTWTISILARALGCPAGWLAFGG